MVAKAPFLAEDRAPRLVQDALLLRLCIHAQHFLSAHATASAAWHTAQRHESGQSSTQAPSTTHEHCNCRTQASCGGAGGARLAMSTTTGKPGQIRFPARADRTGYAPRTDRWLYSQKTRAMMNTVAMMHAHNVRLKGCRAASRCQVSKPGSMLVSSIAAGKEVEQVPVGTRGRSSGRTASASGSPPHLRTRSG